jgi:hypothetical protein
LGPSIIARYRWQQFQLLASASLLQCGKIIDGDLSISWKVFKGVQLVTSFKSASIDTRSFLVPPNTLDSNSQYLFLVTASIIGFPRQAATAAVLVNVGVSGVVAILSGGSEITASASQILELDASSSYDMDYPDTGSLSYIWSCAEFSPSFGAPCPPSLNLGTEAKFKISAGTFRITTMKKVIFTVTVKNIYNASSTASIVVIFLNGNFPTAKIITPSSKFNSLSRVILHGQVNVPVGQSAVGTWTSPDIPNSELIAGSLGSIQSSFDEGITTAFTLTLMSSFLAPGTMYTFSLSVASTDLLVAAVATVKVIMNSPPAGGTLKITPSSGNSLDTVSQSLNNKANIFVLSTLIFTV